MTILVLEDDFAFILVTALIKKTFSFLSFSLSIKCVPITCFLSEEQHHHEKRAKQRINTVGTLNCPVFSFVVIEKSEKLWFGSLMSILSSSIGMILSSSLGSKL